MQLSSAATLPAGWAWLAGIAVLLCYRGRHRRHVARALVPMIVVLAGGLWVLRDHPRIGDFLLRAAALLGDRRDRSALERVGQWEIVLDRFTLMPAGRGLGVAGTSANYHGSTAIRDVISDGGVSIPTKRDEILTPGTIITSNPQWMR